jgi:hypothetical protein
MLHFFFVGALFFADGRHLSWQITGLAMKSEWPAADKRPV